MKRLTVASPPVPAAASGASPATRLCPFELAFLGALALLARTFNLGRFSLWVDEILLVLRSHGSPAQVWAASHMNAEHPPLAALAMSGMHALGAGDTTQRLLPTGLGVASVVLTASWTARHFGRLAGLASGLVLALLPFHVRYSQELRPYAYLLFFAALTLVAVDRVERRPDAASAALLFAALLGGLYSHYLFALVLVPASWPLVEAACRGGEQRAAARRTLRWVAGSVGAALLLFVPWILGVAATLAARRPAAPARPWMPEGILERAQFLTTGGIEGDAFSWAGAFALALLLVGATAALRGSRGRAALAGLLTGSVIVELVLRAARHWSNGRYDTLSAPFIGVLVGVGIARLATGWPHGSRRAGRAVAAAALAALLAGEVGGLLRYARGGRPDWDRVAAAVRQARRPGEPLLVENEWTRISLGYYLQGPDFAARAGEDGAPRVLGAAPANVGALWPPERSALLVTAGYPGKAWLRRWARSATPLAHSRRSHARLVRLAPELRRQLGAPLPPIDSGAAVR
ncbi:MAG TPA: glycosyltransferase family 39 protein [Thermoanaerobaculia bacterium]|nr:glycosyltransferase family 39 protein [Thermoanaerobaculia bacterium]